jgi:hypothetical protein
MAVMNRIRTGTSDDRPVAKMPRLAMILLEIEGGSEAVELVILTKLALGKIEKRHVKCNIGL